MIDDSKNKKKKLKALRDDNDLNCDNILETTIKIIKSLSSYKSENLINFINDVNILIDDSEDDVLEKNRKIVLLLAENAKNLRENENSIMYEKCKKMLELGFYPYSFLSTEIKFETEGDIAELVENDLLEIKTELKSVLSEYNEYIDEIFDFYDEKKYRLCILDIINFTSYLTNHFFSFDFTEVYDDGRNNCKFENKEVIELKKNIDIDNFETWILFPCLNNDNLNSKNNNSLIKNEKGKAIKERYKGLNYNRNSILHGYNLDFGTKINCLRWITVLMNTCELIDTYKMYLSYGGNQNETKI